MTLRNPRSEPLDGEVRVTLPAGWSVSPPGPVRFEIRAHTATRLSFTTTARPALIGDTNHGSIAFTVHERPALPAVPLVFLRDSITDFWDSEDPAMGGRAVWEANFAPMRAANFGIGADHTQHLLWRLQNGELEGLNPAVVLLIGTNNTGFERDRSTIRRNTPAKAIEGITAVVREIRDRLPRAVILLFALFPRGEKDDPVRGQIREINEAISRLAEGSRIRYIGIGASFLAEDGSIDRERLPDLLRPSEKGYAVWAAAIREALSRVGGEG